MFTKQQGNGNKVLQGNKGRLMPCEPLTCKHSNMRNTFKNCFLAIKSPCSPASQTDSAVKSERKSCSDSLIIYSFVCLLMYFPIMLLLFLFIFSCCFTILLWESGISLPGWALQCTLGVTAGHWDFNTIWKWSIQQEPGLMQSPPPHSFFKVNYMITIYLICCI